MKCARGDLSPKVREILELNAFDGDPIRNPCQGREPRAPCSEAQGSEWLQPPISAACRNPLVSLRRKGTFRARAYVTSDAKCGSEQIAAPR